MDSFVVVVVVVMKTAGVNECVNRMDSVLCCMYLYRLYS